MSAGSVCIEPSSSLRLELLPQRAVWLGAQRALFVADLHLGKAASFRRLGVAVPAGTTAANLARLDALIEALWPVRHLVILGDLVHSAAGLTPALVRAVGAWRERHAGLAMTLIAGNHDTRAARGLPDWGLELREEPWYAWGLALCHDPATEARSFKLAGHVHPVYRLGQGIDQLRLPAFVQAPEGLILPAFGEFTGGWDMRPRAGEQLHLVGPDRVWTLPPAQSGTLRRSHLTLATTGAARYPDRIRHHDHRDRGNQ